MSITSRTNFEKVKRTKAANLADAARRAVETMEIFLAGPFIDVNCPADYQENSATSAKRARYLLHRHLTSQGAIVYLGEDVELRINGEQNYGSASNAVVAERHYIQEHIDATILFPSSPGSFCEAGDWISDDAICKSLLIFIDAEFEAHKNYINDGVVKFARQNHAEVVYVDYENHNMLQTLADEFVTKISAINRINKLYGRS